MVYEWMNGFRSSVKAQTAGEIMKRLADEGDLTPRRLVDEARSEDSPLHKGFEWDDAKAAETYRRQQASVMIRAIIVKESAVVEGGDEATVVKVFNMAERGNAYESLDVILASEYKTDSLMARAEAEMRTFRDKYKQIKKLSKVIASMDEVLEEGA